MRSVELIGKDHNDLIEHYTSFSRIAIDHVENHK